MIAIKLKIFMTSDSQDIMYRGKLRTLKPFNRDKETETLTAEDRFIKEVPVLVVHLLFVPWKQI